jgi:hypothetical protein
MHRRRSSWVAPRRHRPGCRGPLVAWVPSAASLLAVVLAVAACSPGRVVVPVRFDETAATTPTPDALTTHGGAVRVIGALMQRELGLPVPDLVTVYVYGSRPGFERGLIHDARVSPVRAAELSDFAVGIGTRRQLLLHDEGRQSARERLRLIAHELTHVSQIELAQGEGRAEQWLAEGMAEWVAFTVLERLALDTVAARRRLAVAGARAHPALLRGRLDLPTLGTPRGFTVRHLREGSLATYQLAFLMTDYLIARQGFPRVVDYFRAFAASADRAANFRDSFGLSLEEFEREVLPPLAATAS